MKIWNTFSWILDWEFWIYQHLWGILLIAYIATIQVDWNFWSDIDQLFPNVSSKTWQKFCFPSRILKWESVVVKILHIEIVSYSVFQEFIRLLWDVFLIRSLCIFSNLELNRVVYQCSIVDSIIFANCSTTSWNCWLVPVHNTSPLSSRSNVKLSGANSLSRAVKFFIS